MRGRIKRKGRPMKEEKTTSEKRRRRRIKDIKTKIKNSERKIKCGEIS